MEDRIKAIRKRINVIQSELRKTGDMRPGNLSRQYQKPKEKKNPYYQVSYTHKMKSRTDYVRKKSIENVKNEIENYKHAKALFEEWVDLGIELSKLKMKNISQA
jgi:uncharacterized protein DUF6788